MAITLCLYVYLFDVLPIAVSLRFAYVCLLEDVLCLWQILHMCVRLNDVIA